MKRRWLIAVLILAVLIQPKQVCAMDLLGDIDWSGLDTSVQESGLPYEGFSDYLKAVLSGEADLSLKEGFGVLLQKVGTELRASWNSIIQLVTLLVISILLKALNTGSIGQYALMIAYVGAVMQSFQIPYEIMKILIQRVQTLGQAEIPILAAITIASGQFTGATLKGEILLSALNILLQLIRSIFMPAVQILLILYMIEAITGDGWSGGMASVLKKLLSKGMKAVTTVLLLLVSLRIQITGISDQWLRKAASNMVSSIPVIGNSLSGAIDTVTSSAVILMQTVGVLGVFLLLMICIIPVLKMLLLWLLYTVMGIMAESVMKEHPKKLMKGLADCVSLLFGLMICVLIAYIGVLIIFVMTVNPG